MRITHYRREIGHDGYFVTSAEEWYWWGTYEACAPIRITQPDSRSTADREATLRTMIGLAKVDEPADLEVLKVEDEEYMLAYNDFCKNYAEIIRGARPDWRLTAFQVSFGRLRLCYAHQGRGEGSLCIAGAERLHLEFELPRNRLGFVPRYKVFIGDGARIDEDLGYVRYENEFRLKKPNEDDVLFDSYDQYLSVTEYAWA